MKKLLLSVAVLVSACGCGGGGGGSASSAPPAQPQAAVSVAAPVDVLTSVALPAHTDATWAASKDLYRLAQPDRWSPYYWAFNAAALQSIQDDSARTDKTARALMAELPAHVEQSPSGMLVRYDYDYPFVDVQIKAPWHSAFANASVAIGLMHLQTFAPQTNAGSMVDSYLTAALDLSHRDQQGFLWFSEYVSPSIPGKYIDVINGHFTMIVAMYEWKRRTGTTAYDSQIKDGLDTMEAYLPQMIQPGYFSYARGYPQVKDYGQERAVRQAQAACVLRPSICPVAASYQVAFASR